jgi:hypothetical protein
MKAQIPDFAKDRKEPLWLKPFSNGKGCTIQQWEVAHTGVVYCKIFRKKTY